MRIALFGLAGTPVVVTIAAYFMLMFRDPDRFQSEEYRLRQRALQIARYEQGASAEIVDVAKEIARTENLRGGFTDGEEIMKRHLLVFDDGSGGELDLQGFVDSLDSGAQMYALDGHVCFLKERAFRSGDFRPLSRSSPARGCSSSPT